MMVLLHMTLETARSPSSIIVVKHCQTQQFNTLIAQIANIDEYQANIATTESVRTECYMIAVE